MNTEELIRLMRALSEIIDNINVNEKAKILAQEKLLETISLLEV